MAQQSKEPCKKEARDIQASLQEQLRPSEVPKFIELLQSCCEKCNYNSTHCASLSGILKQKPK